MIRSKLYVLKQVIIFISIFLTRSICFIASLPSPLLVVIYLKIPGLSLVMFNHELFEFEQSLKIIELDVHLYDITSKVKELSIFLDPSY
jgi:hypothetical protein